MKHNFDDDKDEDASSDEISEMSYTGTQRSSNV